MTPQGLHRLFNPQSVAVVGASDRIGSVGNALTKNLLAGFSGKIFLVNPNRKIVAGMAVYPDVSKIPQIVDLAIIATPAATVPKIVEDCGKAGVGGVIVVSSGFKEADKKGEQSFAELEKLVRKYQMTLLGPNCLGFIRPGKNLNASFAGRVPKAGHIALISQSGALGTAILDWAVKENVGFSYFVSIGEMLDIGFHDLIDYFGNDQNTNSILLYMETLTEARKFLSAARSAARAKPIIALKAGKSLEGARAALSHTGALTGNDEVFRAAFKRAGIVRVNTIGELFDCAETLAMQKHPTKKRLAIVTNAGGPGVIATDALIALGGSLAKLSEGMIESLNTFLPPSWSGANPVDLLGDADAERYRRAVEVVISDENVDGVLVILTPQAMTDPVAVAKVLVTLPNREKKTLCASWMGEFNVADGREILGEGKIPVYRIPENAVRSFMNLYRYARNLEMLYETPASIPHAFTPNTEANRKLLDEVLAEGRFVLTELEAKAMLANYDIPVPKGGLAKTESEAVKLALQIGFPVVMKVLSPDILHKTEIGGGRINIANEQEVLQAYKELTLSVQKRSPRAKIHGILVEEMLSKKYELLIGCSKDPIFGPAIVFGMGGVAVDVFRDVRVGLPPLNMALAMRIIEETKIYNLLKGYRGMSGVDIPAIQFLLYKFAYLIADFPEIKELDINPFAVDSNGGVVLDAKIILDREVVGKKIKPYSHLVISPYPKEYLEEFQLKSGQMVLLRPIRPEDEPMEAEMFKAFSEATQRFRFFGLINEVNHQLLIRYTQIDYDREIAIIAETDENGIKKMAGVVRLIADAYNETAEFAIVVADPWQNQGLGNKFTDYILQIAREKGIKKIYAYVLEDNRVMLQMFRKRGFKVITKDGNFYAELKLA
ncbi:MAG: bifunctional acetate--CoA ligase family protein/GNAT family N-acetyltransferase [Patescibacteria group bacterium]